MLAPRLIGRYALHDEIAAGGMATVHIGRLLGPVGFCRTVAIKRLHSHLAKDQEFVSMFIDEARLAARIRHPNVVATLDVVATDGELFLVMEYVPGETLARIVRSTREAGGRVPVRMVSAFIHGALQGLHAAHEARSDNDEPLRIVHRDVSPQNIHIGSDGVARVLDFGVAKAEGRVQTTQEGQLKGKTSYMAPEQLRGRPVDRRTDVYAAGVVLWEALTGERLFNADTPGETMARVLEMPIRPPSSIAGSGVSELDAIALRALSREPEMRFATALDMAVALEEACPPPTAREVSEYIRTVFGESLEARSVRVREIEGNVVSATGATELAPEEHVTASELRSLAIESTPNKARRRMDARLGAVAIAGLVIVGVFAFRALRTTHPSAATTTIASAPPTTPASTDQVVPPLPVSTLEAIRVVPSATASTAPPPRRALAGRPVLRSKVSCNPPYTIDPDGVHIPKPECE